MRSPSPAPHAAVASCSTPAPPRPFSTPSRRRRVGTCATPQSARPPPPPPRRTQRPTSGQILSEELARELPMDETLEELVEETIAAELGTVASRRVILPRHGVSVTARSLHKEYDTARGKVIGVRSTDLTIRANGLTALVGPSGSGKTTLLRLLSGLEPPTSGRILFDDTDVTDLPPKVRRVGVVFQGYALFRHMSVADNIKFGPRMLGLPGDHDARVAELLDLVELPHIADRLPGQLSGGQKQRVALARALAAEPRLLLLDEPFSALDPEVRRALRAGLRDILDRAGVTAIMVSHDQEEAFAMADDVVIFNRGAVQQAGSPASVRAAPASPFVMDFVHEANKLPADCIFTRRMGVSAGGRPYVMCAPGDVAAHRWPPGGPRPAHADAPLGGGGGGAAVPPPPASSPSPATTPPPVHVGATVIDKSFGGAVRKYVLEFDDGVRLAAHVPTAAGDDGDLEVSARAYVRCEPAAFLPFDVDDLLT